MNDFTGPTGPRENRWGMDPGAEEEARLRHLLSDAVSDIEPRDALGSIHARTEVSIMQSRRSWLLVAGAAVAATAATVVAVTVLSGDGTPGDDPGFAGSPSASPDPSPTTDEPSLSPTGQAGEMQAVPVYYVGDTSRGVRLYREFHQLEVTDDDAVTPAVNEAVSADPADPDYRTSWPEGTTAARADSAGTPDVLTIDVSGSDSLRDRPAGMSKEEAQMAVEQVIYTAQAALQQGRPPVQLLVDGQRTDRLLGVPVSEPLAQGDAVDVLAQVWIIEPAEGAEVTSAFTVSGLAAAFEATVVWELRDRAGNVVADGFTTAEECCTMAPYSFEVDAAPGEYTLVVQDTDASGGEGFGVWEDTKRITVLP